MDTGAHIVCNLLVQSRMAHRKLFAAIVGGAVLPDFPIILFYAWESLVLQTPEAIIWSSRYFLPGWQNFIDFFNSIPIILIALGFAVVWRRNWLIIVLTGMLLHIALDFPFHNDDAHRHFFPISNWRFESPVSYWDPRFHGEIMNIAQIVLVAVGLIWLWIRHSGKAERVTLALLGGGYVLFQIFVLLVWAS